MVARLEGEEAAQDRKGSVMVAYNFKAGFHGPIQRYEKRQTVRAHRKRHARVGEAIQVYGGLRTKQARKLIPDPTCIAVSEIRIVLSSGALEGVAEIQIDGFDLDRDAMAAFAIADGFGCRSAGQDNPLKLFGRFWVMTHGAGVFDGVVIKWQPMGWTDGRDPAA